MVPRGSVHEALQSLEHVAHGAAANLDAQRPKPLLEGHQCPEPSYIDEVDRSEVELDVRRVDGMDHVGEPADRTRACNIEITGERHDEAVGAEHAERRRQRRDVRRIGPDVLVGRHGGRRWRRVAAMGLWVHHLSDARRAPKVPTPPERTPAAGGRMKRGADGWGSQHGDGSSMSAQNVRMRSGAVRTSAAAAGALVVVVGAVLVLGGGGEPAVGCDELGTEATAIGRNGDRATAPLLSWLEEPLGEGYELGVFVEADQVDVSDRLVAELGGTDGVEIDRVVDAEQTTLEFELLVPDGELTPSVEARLPPSVWVRGDRDALTSVRDRLADETFVRGLRLNLAGARELTLHAAQLQDAIGRLAAIESDAAADAEVLLDQERSADTYVLAARAIATFAASSC